MLTDELTQKITDVQRSRLVKLQTHVNQDSEFYKDWLAGWLGDPPLFLEPSNATAVGR